MKQKTMNSLLSNKRAYWLLFSAVIICLAALLPHQTTQAATINKNTKNAATYNFYSNNGKYKSIKISSSGFAGAQCNASNLTKQSATFDLAKAAGKPRALYCTTPTAAGQSYAVIFYTKQHQASAPVSITALPSKPPFGCYFVHSPDSPTVQGLNPNRVLNKSADGACQNDAAGGVTNDPAAPVAQAPSKRQPDPKPKKTTVKPKDKVSTKKFEGLLLPPNFSESQKDGKGYYLIPGSIKDEDYGTYKDSPPSNRYGTERTAAVFYDTAIKYKKKYGKSKQPSKLVLGDVNASLGHGSHCDGINFDVYTTDKSATVAKKLGGNQARSIELAKMFIRTGKVKVIFFNDQYVVNQVNKVYPGKMQVLPDLPTHEFHFHVRLQDKYAGAIKSLC